MSTLKVNNITDLGDDAVVTSGVLDTLAVPAGGILQVVSTTKTDPFTTASSSFEDVTGLSVSITPRSTSSKVLVSGHIQLNPRTVSTTGVYRITRNGTPIAIGDTVGSRGQATGSYRAGDTNTTVSSGQLPFEFLDSPSTASSATYQIQILSTVGNLLGVNTSDTDADSGSRYRTVSTITVMEVAG